MSAGHPLHPWLPHRAPMLLLDSVEQVDAEGGLARARIDPNAWYADAQGAMPAWIGLELMAQAISACRGQHLARSGQPGAGGYLVAARGFSSSVSAFPSGSELQVRVTLLEADPSGLCTFQCALLLAQNPVATATLKVIVR